VVDDGTGIVLPLVGRVLVVVPVLNEVTHLHGLIAGLFEDASSFDTMQVVVVDGGSTDGTIALAEQLCERYPGLSLIHNPARLQSSSVNLAVRQFGQNADFLVRCDAHAVYPAHYCSRLIRSIARHGAEAVVVPMDTVADGTWVQRAIAWVSNSPIGTGGSAHRAGQKSGYVDHGHHAAFLIDAFRHTGGYDETFTHNEDAEFDCRQRAWGGRIYLDGSIRLGYVPRPTLRALGRQYFRYGAGRALTVRRHPRSVRLRQLIVPVHLTLSLLALVLSPWVPLLLAWPALYLLSLLGTSCYFAVRKRSACGLLTGPAAGMMHTAWALGFLTALLFRRQPDRRPSSLAGESLILQASAENLP